MLDRTSRTLVVSVGVAALAFVAIAPQRAHSTADDPPVIHAAGAPMPAGTASPVAIARDPFGAPPTSAPAAARAPAAAPGGNAPQSDDAAATTPLGPLPPNLAQDAIPAIPGAAAGADGDRPQVTAVVTGSHPYAILRAGGTHVIVGIGDRVDGQPIVAIGLDGITLRDGRHLTLDPSEPHS